MMERRDFNLLKLVHKVLYTNNWPSYLRMNQVTSLRTLSSNSAIRLSIPREKDTFRDSAAKIFNSLPDHLRMCDDLGHFCRDIKSFLLSRYN